MFVAEKVVVSLTDEYIHFSKKIQKKMSSVILWSFWSGTILLRLQKYF